MLLLVVFLLGSLSKRSTDISPFTVNRLSVLPSLRRAPNCAAIMKKQFNSIPTGVSHIGDDHRGLRSRPPIREAVGLPVGQEGAYFVNDKMHFMQEA